VIEDVTISPLSSLGTYHTICNCHIVHDEKNETTDRLRNSKRTYVGVDCRTAVGVNESNGKMAKKQ